MCLCVCVLVVCAKLLASLFFGDSLCCAFGWNDAHVRSFHVPWLKLKIAVGLMPAQLVNESSPNVSRPNKNNRSSKTAAAAATAAAATEKTAQFSV